MHELYSVLKSGRQTSQLEGLQNGWELPASGERCGTKRGVIYFRYYNVRVPAEKNRRASKALRSRAAQLREGAMSSQLTAAFTECSVAETALVLDQIQRGRDAVENARHIAEAVRRHLDEPNHVPVDSVAGLRNKLAEIEKQISNLEGKLKSYC